MPSKAKRVATDSLWACKIIDAWFVYLGFGCIMVVVVSPISTDDMFFRHGLHCLRRSFVICLTSNKNCEGFRHSQYQKRTTTFDCRAHPKSQRSLENEMSHQI